jgi:hypothetical protein
MRFRAFFVSARGNVDQGSAPAASFTLVMVF